MWKPRFFITLSLILLFIFMSIPFNVSVLAEYFEGDGVVYITEKDKPEHNLIVDIGNKPVEFEVKNIKSKDLDEIKMNKYTKIVVDGDLLDKPDFQNRLKNLFQKGYKIAIRKNDIKLKEIYEYLDINEKNNFIDIVDNNSDSVLKVVGALIFKSPNGEINTAIIRVEDYRNENEVEKAIMYSLKSEHIEKIKLINFIKSKFNNVAYASELTWNPVASNTWVDYWTSVTVSYSVVLQKNPNNPDSQGKYYTLLYTPIDIDPKDGFSSGYAYFYHDAGGTPIIYDYGPQNTYDTTSISFTLSYPPAVTINFNIGTRVDAKVNAGGIGRSYIQWLFTPENTFGVYTPTSNMTSYELISEYTQSSTYFMGGLAYTIDMYRYVSAGNFTYYGTASITSKYVSGT